MNPDTIATREAVYQRLPVGAVVWSKPVGRMPKFKGEIVGVYGEYIVRDLSSGQEWSRSPRELFVPGRPRRVTDEGK